MASRKKQTPPPPPTLDDLALLLMQTEADDDAAVAALRDSLVAYATGPGAGGADGMMVEAAALALAELQGSEALTEAGVCIEGAMQVAGTSREPVASSSRRRARKTPAKSKPRVKKKNATSARVAADPADAPWPAADQGAQCVPDAIDDAGAWGTLPPEAEVELAEGFVIESVEYLDAAEAALLRLEARGQDVECVNAVFRAFHTIKGTAAFLSLTPLSELAHHAESLLSLVRNGEVRLADAVANLGFRSVDMLRALVDGVRAALGGAPRIKPDGYDALLAELARAVAAHSGRGPAEGAASAASDPDTPDGSVAPEAAAADTRTARPEAQSGAVPSSAAATPVRSAPADRSSDQQDAWIRVRTDRLDKLVDTIGELVIAQSMIAQDDVVTAVSQDALARKVGQASKIVRELQDLSISMRMVPLRPLFQKMARVVRDTAARSGKHVELHTLGEETEIDRNMVDVIGDPLVHMLRNAVDHGIEHPDQRAGSGKHPTGAIHLSAYHAGGSVVVELSDDGRGLDRARIVRKALAQGLIESDRHLTDHDVWSLIFAPGFSTAEQVTDLSGRGVGMDVVRKSIEALRGRVDIASAPGTGTTFTIRLPLTLAMTDGMLVRCGSERYIIPTVNIQMSFRPEPAALSRVAGKGELVMLRGEPLPLLRLHSLYGVHDAVTDACDALLVVIGAGERRCALLVDELLGQQQVVAKSLGRGVGKIQGVSGGAILGDGRVGLILDAGEMIQLARRTAESGRGGAGSQPAMEQADSGVPPATAA